MLFLLFIILGALLAALLSKKVTHNKRGATLMFWLLLLVIFLMGTEIDRSTLTPLLLAEAIGLSIAIMAGSVLCLRLIPFLFRHHD